MNSDGTGAGWSPTTGSSTPTRSRLPTGKPSQFARYVGEGDPHDPNSTNPFQTKLRDFVLVNHNIATGAEQQLTQGQACFTRPDSNPCAPEQGPAYVPQWTPDGNAIGYMSVLGGSHVHLHGQP